MANFIQLQQRVSKRLIDASNTAVSADDVRDAINDAVDYWKFRRFWFNTVRDTDALTAQSGVIPLPVDFLVPLSDDAGFEVEWSNMRYTLAKLDQAQYDALWLGNGYGLPRFYANNAGVYSVYPLPDQAYTIRRNYIKNYVALNLDADINDFTNYAPRLITFWALANLYRDFRQDDKMSDAFFNSAQSEYQNLLVMTTKSNATGGLAIDGNLTGDNYVW